MPSLPNDRKKVQVPDLAAWKAEGRRMTMITAYDVTFARLVDEAGIDMILVGDSVGMVVQGTSNTIPVDLEEMAYHVRCVARANTKALVIGDLPFGSYQISPEQGVESSIVLMKNGAQCIKLEGGVHMAMVMGDIRREQPTLVRVHVIDPLRDLVGADYSGPSNWTLWAALQRVAAEGSGVVVVLANHESSQALLERVPQLTQAPRQFNRSQSRIYSEVGTGAQILQDLGVGKLRHLGPPLKYAGLTGYDLEVVESIPFTE